MKKIILVLSVTAALFTGSIVSYAGVYYAGPYSETGTITKEEAKEEALQYIPEDSQFQYAESKGQNYEVVYYSPELTEYYRLRLSAEDGALREYKSWLERGRGSKSVALSEDEAKEIVLGEVEGAESLEVNLDSSRGEKVYKVRFNTDSGSGMYEIQPEDGNILLRELAVDH